MRKSRLKAASVSAFLSWLSSVAAAEPAASGDAAARAETRRVALDYSPHFAELGCPAPSELRAAVAARLGYDPFVDPGGETSADQAKVLIERNRNGLEAKLSYSGAGRDPMQRALKSGTADCQELGRTLALALSVAIDPMSLTQAAQAASEKPTLEPEKTPPTAPDATPTKSEPKETTPAHQAGPLTEKETQKKQALDEQRSPKFYLHGGARAALGLSPQPTVGALLALGAEFESLGGSLGVQLDAPSSLTRESGGQVHGQTLLSLMSVCYPSPYLAVCARGTLGGYRGFGREIETEREAWAPFAAIGPVVQGRLSASKALRFTLDVGVLMTLTRVQLELDGESVFSTSEASGFLELGVDTIFL